MTAPAFAYRFYNATSHDVYVIDKTGFKGIQAALPAGGNVACNPTSRGCYGRMHFHIEEPFGTLKCHLDIWLDKVPGHYFIVEENKSNDLAKPWCVIKYYRD